MATAAASRDDLRKELTCPICLEYYTEPVILRCGHNFCRFCISMSWDENGGDHGYQCPECRSVFNNRTFTKNYLVQNLVSKMDDLERLSSVPRPAKPLKMDGKCELHGEELKLYCQMDEEAICVVCRESRVHRNHEVAPVSEVAHDMKAELQLRLMNLSRFRSQCLRVIAADERTKNDVRMKKKRLKDKVEADVGALVQFLLDERDSLLDSLDAEEAAALATLDDKLDSVKAEAAVVERHVAEVHAHASGDTTFQSLCKTFEEVVHGNLPEVEPADSPTEFTDFSGPFQLIMWKKMMHVLHTMPQNLTLDPDTAHPNLLISDYDTKVEEVRSRNQPELDPPARFTRFCGVLATAQYCGGQHYWEVDVRDKGVWYLGVTTQGSKRKGFISLTPAAGYWSLCLQDRLYATGTDGRVLVADYWNSPRVGVYLDYDRGLLSFYDAVTMKLLYVFNTCFHQPVYPLFSPGKNDPGSRLRICHYY